MQTVETSVLIHAPAARVWETLVDLDSYAEWNPFISEAAGEAIEGERLDIRISPPGGRSARFRPRVRSADTNERLVWLGRLGIPGLFDGRHEFRLEPLDATRTRLVQRETFSGLLVGLLFDREAITSGFQAMNDALKARAEAVGVRTDEPGDLLAA